MAVTQLTTTVTQLTTNHVNTVKAKSQSKSNNDTLNINMYYDSQGVIYNVAGGNASVYAYAAGIVGTSKSSIITIPSFITYDGVKWPVTSIAEYAFTDAKKYFGLSSVIVPNGIFINKNSGIPGVIRITANTKPAVLAKLSKEDIKDLSKSSLKTVGKMAADHKWTVAERGHINEFTSTLQSGKIATLAEATLGEFQSGQDKSITNVVVNATTYEMTAATYVSQGAAGNIVHSGLGWVLAADVTGATGYAANVATIASDVRNIYAAGMDYKNIPVPAGLTNIEARVWAVVQTAMAESAKVVFTETKRWLEDSSVSDSVVTTLNAIKVALEDANIKLETAGQNDLSVALDKQIAALRALIAKIETAALTTANIAALTTEQVAGLSTAQLTALTTAQLTALTSAQLTALTSTQIKSLTSTQIKSLTTMQINALSSTQVSKP